MQKSVIRIAMIAGLIALPGAAAAQTQDSGGDTVRFVGTMENVKTTMRCGLP